MGSKYLKGDMVRCTRDFTTKSGEVAFKKGKMYSIDEVNEYKDADPDDYEYVLDSEIDRFHILTTNDLGLFFIRVEVNPVIFHRYYCGCVGIPVDSQNGLIVQACDDDTREYFMGFRDMTDKKSEPMRWEDQDELIRGMSSMLARGHGVTDFAFLINQIMKKGGE